LLRVTGGELGGRRFRAPAGGDTRPTTDMVREALFAVLAEAVEVELAADLFAGSGALGIEALSRGAARCLFVERRPAVVRVLQANLAALGLEGRARVLTADAGRPPRRLWDQGPASLVLADPPYQQGWVEPVLALAGEGGLLAPGGWLVVEHSPREEPPRAASGLALADRRAYGQSRLSFYTHPQPS
jgi:16S rRNA (guanine966-N2)-methyltransferase